MNMLFKYALLLLVAVSGFSLPVNGQKSNQSDSFSLKRILAGGEMSGRIRQFSMVTDNAPGLSDYHAVAIGGSLRYETRAWKGFKLTMGGNFVDDWFSSDFTQPDSLTGAYDRYDVGLYEVLELDQKDFIARLEELNMSYSFGKQRIVFGKQVLKTPFLNPQDGRMNPSLMEGLYSYWEPLKHLHLEAGFLYRAAPRSSNKWFSLSESMGVYSMGVNTAGKRANYRGNVKTAGLFVANARYNSKIGQFSYWDYLLENVYQMGLLQWDYTWKMPKTGHKIQTGLQIIREQTIRDGGNPDPLLTYAPKGMKSLAYGGYLAYTFPKNKLQLNYTRITGEGRILSPREWGRDPFFTFMSRERNEGAGDVHALSLAYTYTAMHDQLLCNLVVGRFQLPDVKNFALNKYGLPSYNQVNLDIKYRFKGKADGLDVEFLAVHKQNTGDLHNDQRYQINKVDMGNYNLIFNFSF